jgi:hypothetical protein
MILAVTSGAIPDDAGGGKTARLLEIRSYTLKPGTRGHFHDLFVTVSLPLLHHWNIDVVAYGPSRHDDNSYFLMRSYDNTEQRRLSEDAFYGSDEWRDGPRDAALADIDHYTTILIALDNEAIHSLRPLVLPAHAQAIDVAPKK